MALIVFGVLLASGVTAQPRATLAPSPQVVPLNRHIQITLSLVWSGEADVYDIPQPDLSGLVEFEILERTLTATRKGGENRLRYEFVMRPLKEGEYDLARMQLKYFEKDRDVPIAIPLPQTIVRVVDRQLLSRAARFAIGIGVSIAAIVTAMFFVLRAQKSAREKKLDEAETAQQTRTALLAKINSLRPLRIEGEIGLYLEKLCNLADSDTLRPHTERIAELQQLAENVKFGGYTPSPDELNWAEKIVKRAIRTALPAENEPEEQD